MNKLEEKYATKNRFVFSDIPDKVLWNLHKKIATSLLSGVNIQLKWDRNSCNQENKSVS